MPVDNVIAAHSMPVTTVQPVSPDLLAGGYPKSANDGATGGFFNNMFGALRRIFPNGPLAGEYGVKSSQPVLSPFQANPVPEPQPTQRPAQTTAQLGGSGTPIYAGFVTDLGEYNGKLQGSSAFPTYEKMRRSDPDCHAGINATKLPIRCAQYQVIPGVTPASPLYNFAVEIADLVRENLFGGLETMSSTGFYHGQTFESVLENALLCIDFGCSSHEILWHVDQDKVRIRRLAPMLPMTFFRFYPDKDGQILLALEQYGYRGDEYVNVIIPSEKIDYFTYDKEGSDFYGRSALRYAYAPWWVKSNLWRLDSIAIERNGMGIPLITMPENASDEDKASAQAFVTSLAIHEQVGLTLPFGYDFKLVGMTGRIRDPKASIQHMSEQILRSFLAQFLAFGTTATGSRSLSQDMSTFFKLGLNTIARATTGTMSKSCIRRLVDFNYGDSRKQIPYPQLIHSNIAALDPMELAEKIKNLSQWQVDLLQPDDELENWFRHEYGLPAKTKMRVRWMPVQTRLMEQPAPGLTPAEIEAGKDPGGAPPVVEPINPTGGQNPPHPGTPVKQSYEPGVQPNPHREEGAKVNPVGGGGPAASMKAEETVELCLLLADKQPASPKIVVFDFDGTISIFPGKKQLDYVPGKFGVCSENARELMKRITAAGMKCAVVTARKDIEDTKAWIKAQKLPVVSVGNEKIPCLMSVDDRGCHISWGEDLDPAAVSAVMKALKKIMKTHGD